MASAIECVVAEIIFNSTCVNKNKNKNKKKKNKNKNKNKYKNKEII